MDILFRKGKATAEEVLAELPDPPGYSAVRALLLTLEQKELVTHSKDLRRYVYLPPCLNMIPALTFSTIAAALVFLAGRRDAARYPRLTVLLLIMLGAFPLVAAVLPEIEVPPSHAGTVSTPGVS